MNQQLVVQRALSAIRRQAAGRTVEMMRLCSKRGMRYAALYSEHGGRWRHEGCVKLEHGSVRTVAGRTMEIDGNLFEDLANELCPWCGCGSKTVNGEVLLFARCGRCNMDVCLGRTAGNTFRCCDECGNTGVFCGEIKSFSVQQRSVSSLARTTSNAPASAKCLLGPGRQVALQFKRSS
jgi:hypothetical protein